MIFFIIAFVAVRNSFMYASFYVIKVQGSEVHRFKG